MTDQWTRFQNSVRRHLEFVPAPTFDYSINISLQHRYIYVETPKVCCSTIKLNLQRLETKQKDFTWPEVMDVHNREFSPLLKPSQVHDFDTQVATGNLYTFCFVRNPCTRLLSCYLDKIAGNRPPKRSILDSLGMESKDLSTSVSFGEFVDAIGSQSIQEMNPHWRPQYYQTFQSSLQFDFIGRYENFLNDFSQVLASISPARKEHLAAETRHKTDADRQQSVYYTDEIMEKVMRIFEIDFTTFGYERTVG